MERFRKRHDEQLAEVKAYVDKGLLELDWLNRTVRNDKGDVLLRIEEDDPFYLRISSKTDTLLRMMRLTNQSIQEGAAYVQQLESKENVRIGFIEETQRHLSDNYETQKRKQDAFMRKESYPILSFYWEVITSHPRFPSDE